MPSSARSLALCGILLAASVGVHLAGDRQLSAAHWPTDEAVFRIDGWVVGPATADVLHTDEESEAIVQHSYRRVGSLQTGEFVVWTHPEPQAKTQFRKGPDRDLLGDGYTIEVAPEGFVPPIQGGGALIARRGSQAWLGLYTFGERRGRLGNGPLAWGWAELDALLDTPNDYYLARLLVPLDEDAASLRSASELANVLFARLAVWYQS